LLPLLLDPFDFECSVFNPGRAPVQAEQERIRADAEGAAESDERVGPSDPFAALKLADRGAVKAGEKAKVFLRYPEPVAAASQVSPEDPGKGRIAGSERHGCALQVSCAAVAQRVVVQGCPRWDHDRPGAQGEPRPVERDDRSVDAVAMVELVFAELQLALESASWRWVGQWTRSRSRTRAWSCRSSPASLALGAIGF
jgi:hypothetical protein